MKNLYNFADRRLTAGKRCAHCVRLGFATFLPSLRYGENVACPRNVICNCPAPCGYEFCSGTTDILTS